MGKINAYDKIMIEIQKKMRKYGNKRYFDKSKRSLTKGINSLLKRAYAIERADIIHRMRQVRHSF